MVAEEAGTPAPSRLSHSATNVRATSMSRALHRRAAVS